MVVGLFTRDPSNQFVGCIKENYDAALEEWRIRFHGQSAAFFQSILTEDDIRTALEGVGNFVQAEFLLRQTDATLLGRWVHA